MTTHALQTSGASVIVAERSGSWYSTLFGVFHELAHLLFDALSWRGGDTAANEAEFEKFADAFAGDVLLSWDEVKSGPSMAEMSSDQLAEHLWTLGIGLATARARCGTTGAPCPAPEVTQGDIALRWMRDHGTRSRGSAWASPSYPERLIARHEELVAAGDLPAEVLAWMLGLPPEDVAVLPDRRRRDEETAALLEQLGIPT